MIIEINSDEAMRAFGEKLGAGLTGGEVIELIGDVGAGKTTLTKGIACGLGIDEPIQSPTFTISRVYGARDGLTFRHYDFYRLGEAGIMQGELAEVFDDAKGVTIIEWSDIVSGVLPEDRLQIRIAATSETARRVEAQALGERSRMLVGSLA